MEPRPTGHNPTSASAETGGIAVVATIALAAVFTLGVVIGYNSVYRNVSVAMLVPPVAKQL